MSDGKRREKAWSQGKLRRPPPKRKNKDALEPAERRRLTQLVVCLVLFAAVFVGQGLPEGRLSAWRDSMIAVIHQNTDFKGAFSRMGQSVSEGEPFVETFGTLWSEVLGIEEAAKEESPPAEPQPEDSGESSPMMLPFQEQNSLLPEEGAPSEPEHEVPPQAEPAQTQPETVTPVMGVMASPYGYRDHPIDGEWKEHQGVDIDAPEGTPILAYASGVVDYIGESEAYGLYMQLRHDDGVTTTFYAHCKQINVKNGQQVAAGEQIGEVGQSGNTTGPHLHFEMKRDGVRVDPAEYIEVPSP